MAAFSAASLKKVRLCGFEIPSVKGIKFSSKREAGEVFGCAQRKLDDTDGQIKQECSMELALLSDWIRLRKKIIQDGQTPHTLKGDLVFTLESKGYDAVTYIVPIVGIKGDDIEIGSGSDAIGKNLEFIVDGKGAKINGQLID